MQIKEGNKWKVAFLMNKGLFKPQVILWTVQLARNILKNDE